jgi:hypothetical protein
MSRLVIPLIIPPPLIGRSAAYWLNDPPDLSCKDSTRQHPVDDPLLSCRQLAGIPGGDYGICFHSGEGAAG